MDILPPSRPRLPEALIAKILRDRVITDAVAVIGVRGYYQDTMGAPGVNDRGIYDDALFIHTPDVYAAFNANTDPSRFRSGIAVLRTGIWRYKPGIHGLSRPADQQYPAFVQAGEVTVDRDQEAAESGFFGINIHRGGYGTTSSLGCQTLYPDQWDGFYHLLYDSLKRNSQRSFPYLLIEGPLA